MLILEEGVLDILLLTPHDSFDPDLRVLARAMADLELPPLGPLDSETGVDQAVASATAIPESATPDTWNLEAEVASVRAARGTFTGVAAACLLLIAFPLLGRIERPVLRRVIQGGAVLMSFMLMPVVANFWGDDPASAGKSWFITLVVLGIPLAWLLRRRASRAGSRSA
jgi:hypothetical protein